MSSGPPTTPSSAAANACTAGEIRALIREGYRDMNEIKAVDSGRHGLLRGQDLHRRSSIASSGKKASRTKTIVDQPKRPLFMEVPLGTFAGMPTAERGGDRGRLKTAYDVIIIGAGSVGTPAALSMAEGRPPGPGPRRTRQRRAGLEQGGHRRHPRHPLRPGQDPHLPAQPGNFSTWKELRGDDIEWHKGGYMFVAYREREEKPSRTSSSPRRPSA